MALFLYIIAICYSGAWIHPPLAHPKQSHCPNHAPECNAPAPRHGVSL